MALLAVAAIFTMLSETSFAQNSNSSSTSNTNSSSTSNTNSSSSRNSNSNMSGQSGSMGGQATMLSSTDRKFMMDAAAGGMAEVEMARLALEKASSADVKRYAQQMIDDHTRANEELMQVASQKGVQLPTGPDTKHMALMGRMRNLSGAEFDRMYIKEAGINDHAKMEKLFMKESRSGKDADARGFATKTLPAVQMHLRMAREMSGTMMGRTMKGKM
jgi:putative membrane protein